MSTASKGDSFLIGTVGLVFFLSGTGMIVFQLLTEEILFNVDGSRGQVPMGLEFAFVFFSVGLAVIFVALGMSVRSPKRGAVFNHLAAGTGIGAAVGVAALVMSVMFSTPNLFWGVIVVWTMALIVCFRKAQQSPAYVHADTLVELSRATSPTFRPPEDPRSTRKRNPSRKFALKVGVIAGTILALFPIVFFGFVGRILMEIEIPGAFIAVAAGVVGLFGFLSGYGMSRSFQTAFATREEALVRFADRVNGTVEKQVIAGREFEHAVVFTHEGSEARLDLESRGSGERSVTFTFIRFDLQGSIPCCHVFPYIAGTSRGKEDIVLGWDVFDDLYIVHLEREDSLTEQKLRQVLGRKTQESLLRLKQWAREERISDLTELRVQEEKGQLTLYVYIQGAVNDGDNIVRFYEHCVDVYDGMTISLSN